MSGRNKQHYQFEVIANGSISFCIFFTSEVDVFDNIFFFVCECICLLTR